MWNQKRGIIMNKTFKKYSLIWIICITLFNVVAFVTPCANNGVSKFSGSFWIGYIFITIAFLGNLGCSHLVFKSKNLKKLFYNIPLIRISSIGLFVMLIFGGLAMVISGFPIWISVIVCFAVLAFTAIGIISSFQTADTVESIDTKIKTNTEFIRIYTMRAENLIVRAKTDDLRKLCEKVYKAFRYSDPISNEKIIYIEKEIEKIFNQFETAASTEDIDNCLTIADKLIVLISERNNAVKLYK